MQRSRRLSRHCGLKRLCGSFRSGANRACSVGLLLLLGCGPSHESVRREIDARLAGLGLELVAPLEAGLPSSAHAEMVPLRVIELGDPMRGPILDPTPSGWVLTGVLLGPERELQSGSEAVWRGLEGWVDGDNLTLRVELNPYRAAPTESRDLEITLPPGD